MNAFLKLMVVLACTLLVSTGCTTKKKTEPQTVSPEQIDNSSEASSTDAEVPTGLTSQIEQAHEKGAFLSREAIQFDLVLTFGGKERLNGTITTATNSSWGLIELSSGGKIYVDKNKVFCSPALADKKSVRFDAYTWTYFFLFPYKLSDPGTQWSAFSNGVIEGKLFNTQKLSFAAGIGDAPDDWYILFTDPETHVLEYVAYIVTAGKSQEEAEADPHAIQYKQYKKVDEVPIAHEWVFWEWRKEKGVTRQLGQATLSNVAFVSASPEFTEVPEGFVEIQ
ncbi:MAG: DUF6503 family protein [Bacteroidota bacterium]